MSGLSGWGGGSADAGAGRDIGDSLSPRDPTRDVSYNSYASPTPTTAAAGGGGDSAGGISQDEVMAEDPGAGGVQYTARSRPAGIDPGPADDLFE